MPHLGAGAGPSQHNEQEVPRVDFPWRSFFPPGSLDWVELGLSPGAATNTEFWSKLRGYKFKYWDFVTVQHHKLFAE